MSNPIRYPVVRWKCPHCSRSHASKSRAAAHIARCWWNPEARSCKTCKSFIESTPPFCGDPGCNGCGGDEECQAGIDMPERGLPVHCPKWEGRGDDH